MADTATTRQSMAVITTEDHRAVLEEWVGDQARSLTWVIGEENPDFEAILRSLANQMVGLTLIDDAAMAYRDVSEGDVLRFAQNWNRNDMGIVFVAGPDRTRDDAFLRALPSAGVTSILPTRYFAGKPEGARALLLSMLDHPPSAEDITAALDALPEEKRTLMGSRRKHVVDDVLKSAEAVIEDGEDGELMDEAAYFESMRAARKAPPDKAEHAEEPAGKPEQGPAAADAPEIDIKALGKAIGIGVVAAKPAARAEKAVEPERTAQGEPGAEAPKRPRTRCQKVAVAGLSRKAGCTHLAHSISFAIKEGAPNARVCCLMSDKREFDAMMSAPGEFPEVDGFRTHKGVAFAFLGKNDPVPEGFDFIVIDCDVVTKRDTRTHALFSTASRRFVVCGGAPWHIQAVGNALAGRHRDEYVDWTWCLFGASTPFKAALARLLHAQGIESPSFFEVPYQNDYLDEGRRSPGEFADLFKTRKKRRKPATQAPTNAKADDGGAGEEETR